MGIWPQFLVLGMLKKERKVKRGPKKGIRINEPKQKVRKPTRDAAEQESRTKSISEILCYHML